MDCPDCGGPAWDNQQKIAKGWRGPRYKCQDQACGWVKWPPKAQRPPKGSATAQPRSWREWSDLYGDALKIARHHVRAQLPQASPTDVLRAAETIFTAAARDGVTAANGASGSPEAGA